MVEPPNGPLTIVVPLPPSYRGGTEEYAYQLAQRFSARGPVDVFTTTARWDPSAPCVPTGHARISRLPAVEALERPLLIGPRSRARLFRSIARGRALQLHMPFPLVEAPAVRVARRAGIPSVLTYHMDAELGGASRLPGAGWVTSAYRRLSAIPALESCDVVVSNSLGYAQASPVLSRFLHKVRVVRKGVDPARLGSTGPRSVLSAPSRPECVPAAAAPPGASRLLFLGRLVPYKGLPVLLAAMRTIVEDGANVRLLIAGRGPLEGELRQLCQNLGIDGRVTFLGFVPDRSVGALYRFADVVVAPSITTLESTATALEEAAMCGTPVVGSDLPGAGETIPNDGRRGQLVPPNDPEALAGAIRRMLDAGRPEVPIPLHTWDDTAREYDDLFRSLGARRETVVETEPAAYLSARTLAPTSRPVAVTQAST